MADGSLPIVVTPEAFGRGAFDLTVVEGLTVRAMLVEAVRSGLPIEALSRTEIYVAGARLDRQTALDHVLTADQVVNVVVEPMGGGGGRKDIGQILLTVAVIAVSAWVGGGAATPAGFFDKLLVRTALAGAVGLAGQALIGALYGPGGGPAKANDRYALQSASNQYRQWGPMPLALGEVVTAPDLAAKTFTQSQGDDVWMYGILGLHYGPCEVAEVKIGDTLVSTMGAGDFRMVQHLEPGPRTFQLYPNDVDQLDLNEELKATPSSATPLVRAASSDGSRFDLDFFLPAGLYFQKDDGRVLTAHASVAVRYRPIDQTGVATGPWQSGPSWARTSATKDPIRVTHSVHLPHGRYEFELTRNRPDDGNDKRRDTSYAVDLRTKGGLYDGVPIQTQPGVTREILFASARAPSVCPAAGDLIAFGEVEKVSEDVEIIAIEPGENLTAVLTGVRYVAPLLMAGETGPIPPLTSKLSGDRQANPPRPTLLGVTADAHAVRVSFDMPTWRGAPLSGFSVRWRAKGEEGEAGSWAPLPALDAAARELVAPPLREAPVEGVEATRVEIEITAATVDGRVSPPLQVTVVKPVPGAPLASIWSVDPKGPDANGVSQPILIVRGEVNDPNVAAVRIAWGLTPDGPWTEAYEGAPLTKALEIGNLTPGVEHHVAITHLSAQGVPSQFLVIGPRVPGQLVAGDTTHLKGYPVQDILDKLSDVETISAANAAAVADLDGRVDDTITAAEAAIAAGEAANLAVLKAGEAGDAAVASNIAAGIATTKADEAEVSAQAANAEKLAAQAARDTADQKAQASVVAAAQAEAFAGDAGDWAAASEGAAVQAAASAGEGLSYRNQAIDARDGAVASSQSAGVSASTALGAVRNGPILPSDFRMGLSEWTNDRYGAPDAVATTGGVVVNDDPVFGTCWSSSNVFVNAGSNILTKGVIELTAGRVYEVRVKGRVFSSDGSVTLSPAFLALNQSYGQAGVGIYFAPNTVVTGNSEFEVVGTISSAAGTGVNHVWPSDARMIRCGLRLATNEAGLVVRVKSIITSDVTDRLSAANSAASALSQSSNASAAAASAQISANLAAQVGGRSRRVSDGTIFTSDLGGSPAGAPDLTAGVVLNDYLENAVREVASAINIQTKGVLEIGTGRTFRVYARTRVMVDGPNNTTYPHFRVLDASYASIGLTGPSRPQAAADMWQTYSHELTSEQIKAAYPTAFYIRGAVRVNRAGTTTGSSGATTRVAELWLEDLSELAPISAQLAIVGGVAADAADRLSTVRFDVTGGAGGDPFQIWGQAGPDGSMAGMVASELSFSTVVRGLVVKAMRLIGGDVFVINRLFVGPNKEIEIEPFTPAINWTMGGARLAIGKLANDNLLFWFGPNVTPANMRKSNAALWLDRAGGAYFGGALSAGTLTNKAATTSLSFGATTETARFNSHGGTITVTLSLSGGWNKGYWNSTSLPAATESGNVVVTLYRSVNGGAFSPVVTLPMTYNWSRETREFEPGLGWHVVEQGGYAGSLTYTDPQTNTQDRQYRATITTFSPITQTGIMTSQNLSIIAVE